MAVQVERCTPFFRTIYFKLQQQQQQQLNKSAAAWAEPTGDGEWRANDQVFARSGRKNPTVNLSALFHHDLSLFSWVGLGLLYIFPNFFFLLFSPLSN